MDTTYDQATVEAVAAEESTLLQQAQFQYLQERVVALGLQVRQLQAENAELRKASGEASAA